MFVEFAAHEQRRNTYPLVICYIAIEHGHINSEFSHEKWWFSIVMWQFTRPGTLRCHQVCGRKIHHDSPERPSDDWNNPSLIFLTPQLHGPNGISGCWFQTSFFKFSISYMGCHPSHWRTHIIQRGRSTTNQIYLDMSWNSQQKPWFRLGGVFL